MIDPSILSLFIVTTLFLAVSPGPDLILISTYSSTRGLKSGVMISFGIFIAGLIQTALVAFGLGKLMQTVPPLVLAIKLIGAIYLTWLGVNLLRGWFENRGAITPTPTIQTPSNQALICRGLFNNLINPKALLFFSMFLPQFTNYQGNFIGQILLLGTLLSSIVFCVNIIFALSFSKLGNLLGRNSDIGRHFDGILGIVFLGLAARLATNK